MAEFDNLDRRTFLKLLGWSSLLLTVPGTTACIDKITTPVQAALVKSSDDGYSLIRAFELIDGLDFLSPGDSVLLKLALNSSNPFPATTSPFIVAELVKLLKERGAGDILVGDKSPTWQDTINCLQETGIYDAAVDAGEQIIVFEDKDMVPVMPEKAVHWPQGFSIPKIFTEIDHVIVLPTLRTHQMAGFTMGIKIFVGVLPQDERFAMHKSLAFFESIAEIALGTDKVRLSILDARQGFNSEGPDSGNLINPGIVIASKDLVAADAVGLALLKSEGAQVLNTVWQHPTIKQGIAVHSPGLSSETLKLLTEGIDVLAAIEEQLHL
jgi:uncharacterized protein (DUF362 family)